MCDWCEALASQMLLAWEALLEQARANRVTAEALLIAIRGAQGCHDAPCQDDELQAWFRDAQGVTAIAQASLDLALDLADGPNTPPPRCCGGEYCSTPPKAALGGNGCRAAAVSVAALDGEEGAALDGEEGPPTLCVVPAFPTSHGGLVRARIANIEEVVQAYREEGGLSEAARASAIEPDAEDIGEAEGGSSAGIEKVVGAMPRPPEVCDEAFETVERAMNSGCSGVTAGRLIQVCDRTGNVWTIGADCLGVAVGCNGDSDDAGIIGGNLVAAGCSSATIEGVVGGMPRPPEAGVAVGVDCILYGCGVAGGCSSVGCEEVLGGLPRPPEVALVAGVDCEHALGCCVDEENLVGATTRPPEVRMRSGDALGEGTQPSKANTTRDAHPPLHSSVALVCCESGIQNVLGPVAGDKQVEHWAEVVEDDKSGGINDIIGGTRKSKGRKSKATKGAKAKLQVMQDSEDPMAAKIKQMEKELRSKTADLRRTNLAIIELQEKRLGQQAALNSGRLR